MTLRLPATLAALALLATTACAPPPPASPQEVLARRIAGAEYLLDQCAVWLGGYGDADALASDLRRWRTRAEALGVTDEMYAEARSTVAGLAGGARILAGDAAGCRTLAAQLAKAKATRPVADT